jgi:hypothetical protein
MSTLKVAIVDAQGRAGVLDDSLLQKHMTLVRWNILLQRLLSTKGETQHRRLEALWQLFVRQDSRLHDAQAVRFYEVTRSTLPGRATELSVHEQLVWELPREWVGEHVFVQAGGAN